MTIADYGFAIWETFYVTVLSTAFSLVIGLPLGVLLVAGDKDGILPLPGWLMHAQRQTQHQRKGGGEHRYIKGLPDGKAVHAF